MNDLLLSIAQDLSVEFARTHYLEEPADEYIDPLVSVFGENPTQDDAKSVLNDQISKLTEELSDWLELDLKESAVKKMLSRALTNFYGKSF